MDSTIRLVTKSATWQVAGFIMMTLISYLFTGSVMASSGIAIVGSVTGFISYFLHEMVWSRVSWGRKIGSAIVEIKTGS
ncbi:MAG: DUF2061 domain-containing protein [Jannaschia helgolandensis]|uniref:Uncharacterized membrane protein n=1 Tax=Jannaschia helgolandensis TaxID=188906 RepID=A0A1H7FTR9_9RHOB|nr:DUF2061 domain-containing protein [Jannaschia helgolandensis]SEK29496.1 Uncharacterized membrane protein [Jannaschia helgolandensis]